MISGPNYTSMPIRLSGLSPFMGDSDVDTFANITRADYDFDDDAFEAVSQEAKDFISGLLVHRKEDRLTAEDCLASQWLSVDDGDNKQSRKICTDKLKKFIIRRKWQVCSGCQVHLFLAIVCLREVLPNLCDLIFNNPFVVCVCAN